VTVSTENPALSQFIKPLPLLIVDSHPIQYKAPVYRKLAELYPGSVFVLYGCDASVQGKLADPEFGRKLAWGEQLLEGYPHAFLSSGEEVSLGRFSALKGAGINEWLNELKPCHMLLSQCNYQMDFRAILGAKRRRCKIWIRHETQDAAFKRSRFKSLVRALYYRALYLLIDGAFACGKANRSHLLRHGMKSAAIGSAPYCVPDTIRALSTVERDDLRTQLRAEWGCQPETKVVLFSGKFIPKKNPELICQALAMMPEIERQQYLVVFAGSGPLEGQLKGLCEQHKISSVFAGFVDQEDLPKHYLAADIMVLPSRRMGETWGLVANEALQAGCAVALSDAVGSHLEFGGWERVAVFIDEQAEGLRDVLRELALFVHDFDWCRPSIEAYSVEAAAEGIALKVFEKDLRGGCN